MKPQITIKQIQELLIKEVKTLYVDDDTSRRMWWASLEVIQKDFLLRIINRGGYGLHRLCQHLMIKNF